MTKTKAKKDVPSKKQSRPKKAPMKSAEAQAEEILRQALTAKKAQALAEINLVLEKYNFNIVLAVNFSSQNNVPTWQMDLNPRPKPAENP